MTVQQMRQIRKLLKVYIIYRDPTGTIEKGLVLLDTMSNVSFAREVASLPRKKLDYEDDSITGIGGSTMNQNCYIKLFMYL